MHLADALLSPAVGATMWAATAGTISHCSRQVKRDLDDSKVPLMGVLAAFVFAIQMINFSIPATGSSGHLGGGMLLAILLGPYAAFLSIASVLTVQALFFADGGLLALGCNIFNLGVFPCFIAYPLIYQKIVGESSSEKRLFFGALLSCVVALQLGAFGVVLETVASGISDLPFNSFVLLMQPIHLAIGCVEGVVTAAVVLLLWRARPEFIQDSHIENSQNRRSGKKVLVGLLVATLVTAGGLSWFASPKPDGLEWAISRISKNGAVAGSRPEIYSLLSAFHFKSAILPDYHFSPAEDAGSTKDGAETWPAVDAGTTVSGLVGGVMTLGMSTLIGFFLKRRHSAGTA